MPQRHPRQPNILFLMTDQQRHDALGCVNPIVKTPTLDSIAARGVRFSQAVCNVPMCVASRYSMMTGLYGFQVGVKHNTQMIASDHDLPAPVLAQRLLEAGYQTAGFGKTHWYIGSRIMPDVVVDGSRRGFQARAIRGQPDKYNNERGSLYMADDEPDWHERVQVENDSSGPGGESVHGYTGDTSEIPPEHTGEGWLTRQALNFLDADRDPDRPLFLYLSLDYPHVGFHVPRPFEELYNLDDFDDNPPPAPVPGGHVAGHRYEDVWPKMTSEQRRRSHLRYAALCSYVDHLFGQVIERLRRIGELDNTFIMFTSDHGDMMGDRGRVSKYCLYEGSVRVPLIVAGPGVNPVGRVDDRPAELVDMLPTLLDVAGVPIPEFLPGVSLLSGFSRVGSFAEMHGRGYEQFQRAPAVMWRKSDWKLITYLPGRLGDMFNHPDQFIGELYNLADDPLEMKNRYDDPTCAAVRQKMTCELLMHIMCAVGRYPGGPTRAGLRVTGPETRPDASMWDFSK